MPPFSAAQRQLLSTLLSLSARAETLSLVQIGGRGYADLWAQQRALTQRLAALLRVATTHEVAALEARLELARTITAELSSNVLRSTSQAAKPANQRAPHPPLSLEL